MKKSSGKKRVSSLTFLIATTAVLAAVVLVVQVHARGIMLPPIPGAGVAVVAMLLALLPLGMAVLVVQELCA